MKQVFFGNDPEFLYLRVDPVRGEGVTVHIDFHGRATGGVSGRIEFGPMGGEGVGAYRWWDAAGAPSERSEIAAGEVVELKVPLALLGLEGDDAVRFQVKVFKDGLERECYPERVPIEFPLTRKEYLLEHWMV